MEKERLRKAAGVEMRLSAARKEKVLCMRGVEVWLDMCGDVNCRGSLSSEPVTEVGEKRGVGMRMGGTVTPTRR
jgi:hypothetical protein